MVAGAGRAAYRRSRLRGGGGHARLEDDDTGFLDGAAGPREHQLRLRGPALGEAHLLGEAVDRLQLGGVTGDAEERRHDDEGLDGVDDLHRVGRRQRPATRPSVTTRTSSTMTHITVSGPAE